MNNPLIRYIKWRILKNKNAIICINGPTGSGKSYSAISLGISIAEEFKTPITIEKNLDFGFTELLKKMSLDNNQKPGTVFLFEEVGSFDSGGSARQWQSKANLFFNSFLQTSRHRNQILIMTFPNFAYLDYQARQLVHIQMNTAGINYTKKIAYLKPYILQTNTRTGKIYFKNLRYDNNNKKTRLTRIGMKIPPNNIIDEYEIKKKQFTDSLNKAIMNKKERKKKKDVDIGKMTKYMNLGLNQQEIAKLVGTTRQAISYAMKNHKKRSMGINE